MNKTLFKNLEGKCKTLASSEIYERSLCLKVQISGGAEGGAVEEGKA